VKCHNSGNECDWTGELINLPVSKQRFFISTLSSLYTLWGKSGETSPDLKSCLDQGKQVVEYLRKKKRSGEVLVKI